MPFQTLLLFFFFLSLPAFLGAQVTVLGKLEMGDTAHLNHIKTIRNDEFVGNVLSWSVDSIRFKTRSNLLISFSADQVKLIEVMEDQGKNKLEGAEMFLLKTKDGKSYYGFLQAIYSSRISFNAGKGKLLRFKADDVVSIEPIIAFSSDLKEFSNNYTLKNTKGIKSEGELVGYENGQIMVQQYSGEVTEYPIKSLEKVELKKSYSPYLSYDRSLMFMPTGFGMHKSAKEYRNIGLAINTLAIGLSEHLSLGIGLLSFLPYADLKLTHSLGKYVHWSGGGFVFVPFSAGYHTSVSLGTPDYFLNFGYLRNIGVPALSSEMDFETVSFGASMRVGKRSRLFSEFNIMNSSTSEFGGYDVFYEKGFANSFSWGYGHFARRFRYEIGIMGIGPIPTYCFPGTCPDITIPIPFFAFGLRF